MSTIALATRGIVPFDRTRHVAIRCAWFKDHNYRGDKETTYMPPKNMTAAVLTKPLRGKHFKSLLSLLLLK